MNQLVHFSIVAICLAVADVQAQRPEPGIWWGISPGVSVDERLQIDARADGLVMISVPLAKAPAVWGPIAVAADGTIEFHRAADPLQPCVLKRTEYDTYQGSCRGSVTRPLTLAKRGNPGGLDVAAGDRDLEILAKARQILSGPSVWNRHDDRNCDDSRAKRSWSLYCALDQASLDLAGVDLHVRPVMQETRAAAVEVAGHSFQRSLMDFNNGASTEYTDIVKVFDLTERRLRTMAACIQGADPNVFAGSPGAGRADARPVRYWVESIGRTVNAQTFELANVLGPMDQRGQVPDDWVAASTAVKRRNLPDDARHPIDVTGTLANGHHWRYASLCGESLQYHDASAEAAGYFDRLIDGVYFPRFKTVQ